MATTSNIDTFAVIPTIKLAVRILISAVIALLTEYISYVTVVNKP